MDAVALPRAVQVELGSASGGCIEVGHTATHLETSNMVTLNNQL